MNDPLIWSFVINNNNLKEPLLFYHRRKQRANVSSKTEPCLMGTTTTVMPLDGNNRCVAEQQSIDNIYSFINHDQMKNIANSVDDTEYDKAGNTTKTVCKELHYNHLSGIVKSSFSDTLEGVLSKRDTLQYSFAKDLKD